MLAFNTEDALKISELKTGSYYFITYKGLGFIELPCFIRFRFGHELRIAVLDDNEGIIKLSEITINEETKDLVFFSDISSLVLNTIKDKERYLIRQNLALAKNLSDLKKFLG